MNFFYPILCFVPLLIIDINSKSTLSFELRNTSHLLSSIFVSFDLIIHSTLTYSYPPFLFSPRKSVTYMMHIIVTGLLFNLIVSPSVRNGLREKKFKCNYSANN